MLQMDALNRLALEDPALHPDLHGPSGEGEALERGVDSAIALLRARRTQYAHRAGGLARIAADLDGALRTDALEYMDRPDYPEEGKLAIAKGVHLMNVVTASYRRFFAFLVPMLMQIETRTGRPARVLELASGAGGFALALAKLAKRQGISVEITGSDIVPLYVSTAQKAAAAQRSPAAFRVLDAVEMPGVARGEYDIVFIAQSSHHFSPGKLARMIAEARRVATTAFVGVDGFRSVGMLAFVAGTALLTFEHHIIHDAIVTARKFYSAPELAAIARMAAPGARVSTSRIRPLNSVLTVRFDEGEDRA